MFMFLTGLPLAFSFLANSQKPALSERPRDNNHTPVCLKSCHGRYIFKK